MTLAQCTAQLRDPAMDKKNATENSENANEGYFVRLNRISNSEGFESLSFSERWRLIYAEAPKKHKLTMKISFSLLFAMAVGWGVVVNFDFKHKLSEKSVQTAQESQAGISDNDIIKTVWNGFKAYNRGDESKYYSAEIIKKGSVPPKAMNSSVEGRLPAYLVCYDMLQIGPYGDSRVDMCVYYKENPETNKVNAQWRGKSIVHELESFMSDDGFSPN